MQSRVPWDKARGVFILAVIALFVPRFGHGQTQTTSNPEVQQLRDELTQMKQELDAVKAQLKVVTEQKTPVVDQATQDEPSKVVPPSPPATRLDLYGFTQLDAGYDFATNNPSWFDVMRPTQLNAFPGEFAPDGKFYFSVRQTRFGVKTSTDTSMGLLKTIFEFELFGTGVDAGQTTFRIRHAYGELGPLGAGQTWSPFMDIDVFPNSLEYWGPNGMVFFRNLQIRFMPLRGERNSITLAIEKPGASADGGVYTDRLDLTNVKPKFDMPDFSGNFRTSQKWGYLQLSGILRKISWVDTSMGPLNLGGDALGWGVSASSNVKFSPKDTGKFQFTYGEGIENYMNDAPVDIGAQANPGNVVTPVKGVALPVLGVVSFLDHTWSERFTSAVGYSMLNISNSDGQLPSAFHQGQYALGNLLYHPIKPVMIGGEFQFGRRINFGDGFNTNDYRLQFSFRYDWSKVFDF